MTVSPSAAKQHHNEMEKEVAKWHPVGSETITVPAGTFSCKHWTSDEGKSDVWASSKVSPMGVNESVEEGRKTVLTKIITDANTKITGPVKFDPQMMMQQRIEQRQPQQNP